MASNVAASHGRSRHSLSVEAATRHGRSLQASWDSAPSHHKLPLGSRRAGASSAPTLPMKIGDGARHCASPAFGDGEGRLRRPFTALRCADSVQGDHDGSTAELDASRASHVPGCCKHESSCRADGGRAARIGQSGQRRCRAARPLWSESGGRGGVSDLGGGERLTGEASAASTSGSRSARTRNVALWARRPRDTRWNKSD